MKFFSFIVALSLAALSCTDAANGADDYPLLRDVSKIRFEFFSRKKPTVPSVVRNGNGTELKNSSFDPSKPVHFYSHGWYGSSSSIESVQIKDEILKAQDANVILLDWSIISMVDHDELLAQTPQLGRFVADFLEWMAMNGMRTRDLHVIGFSMGGHVVGMAGRSLKTFRIPHITACDPPGFPNINTNLCYEHILTKDDAEYVETIHTSMSGVGQRFPLSHVDFYLDGGERILTCPHILCSHMKGVQLYIESINRTPGWLGTKCQRFADLAYKKCLGEVTIFGGLDMKLRHGIYNVDISEKKLCGY